MRNERKGMAGEMWAGEAERIKRRGSTEKVQKRDEKGYRCTSSLGRCVFANPLNPFDGALEEARAAQFTITAFGTARSRVLSVSRSYRTGELLFKRQSARSHARALDPFQTENKSLYSKHGRRGERIH